MDVCVPKACVSPIPRTRNGGCLVCGGNCQREGRCCSVDYCVSYVAVLERQARDVHVACRICGIRQGDVDLACVL